MNAVPQTSPMLRHPIYRLCELPDGLHPGIPSAIYHERALGLVSKGALEVISRSAARYKAWVDYELDDEQTPALEFGSAFHCAILEPDRFEREYIVEPEFGDRRKKDNKAASDAWHAANKGRTILTLDAMEDIVGMTKSAMRHKLAGNALRNGEPELTALWTDEETGLRCRIRADFYVPSLAMVVDVKSTHDARAESFDRDVFRYRYHWQHALYRLGFAALGEKVEHFVFIAIEKTPPYDIAVCTLDDRGVALGYRDVRRHISTMAECMREKKWPGYPVGIRTIQTPRWET